MRGGIHHNTTTRVSDAPGGLGHGGRAFPLLGIAICSAMLGGCAAFTNPIGNGVPVRILPDEVLAPSRENYEPVDLTLLRQERPEQFLLDTGDTLGIYVEGIIGDESTPPPVNLPASADMPPAIGYPFAVRADGTVSLPLAGAVRVAGMSIEDAEQAVIDAYIEKEIVREEDYRIIVSLLRPRTVRVLVVREDGSAPGITFQSQSFRGLGSQSTTIGGGRTATGNALDLPVYENDLLTALTSTGGLPGEATERHVLIYRGYASGDSVAGCYACQLPSPEEEVPRGVGVGEPRVIRVPIRKRCGASVHIPREDVILEDGDIVVVRPREPELYYTGGLLPASEQLLPPDYDLTVVEAVLRGQGPLVNGGINSSNLNGNIVGAGIGNPSPSLLTVLRKLPGGQQINIRVDLSQALRDPRENILVAPDDVLVLQENRDEAISRYFTNVFQVQLNFRWLNRQDAQGTGLLVAP